ncbi:DUF4235 domain-containing protein [Streptomyces sp. NBC_01304]|uniref:DUF4235 domain-containing protein n=1 Tax=Streptomyces sp. NBC_01304 TaxID=2903818 RepID=UPI002E12235A|nr:DUF4235 domain-containing protein [Streptomyces sp. NBC_01304]
MDPAKLMYKPVGMVVGVLGGALAGMAFRWIWAKVDDTREAPKPLDEERSWREVLPAAALEGATFAVVRAAVERGGATAFRRTTGKWPA